MAALRRGSASTDKVGLALVQVTVNCRNRPPTAPEKAGSTVPLARASSPSVMLASRFGLVVHFAATVPVTVTVPLATVWAAAGVAMAAVAAARVSATSFFMGLLLFETQVEGLTVTVRVSE